ncbi:MAG: carboxypeptidase regulatory-like domain-containing protein [candidate division Zixibacteria bacterium]|nr:carboxypeptidase regulatory-like domain-containing protein [candidate division Zixibacteria bacterium]
MKLFLLITVLLISPIILSAQEPDVYILVGSPGGDTDTVTYGIAEYVEIPIYYQAAGNDTINSDYHKLYLGINNGYILEFDTSACTLEYPISQWYYHFRRPHYDFYTDDDGNTWDSCLLWAYTNSSHPGPPLVLYPGDPPVHGLTYVCRTVYRPELIDSVIHNALGPGHSISILNNLVIEEKYANVKFDVDADFNGNITGTTNDAEGNPIESVLVEISNIHGSTYTNHNGVFYFPHLIHDSYSLEISHPDYCDIGLSDIIVDSPDTISLDIVLEHGGVVTGIVTDESSNPLENALIEIIDYYNLDSSNSVGHYSINGLCPGGYTIRASAESFQNKIKHDVPLYNNDTTMLDIEMCYIEFPPDTGIMIWAGGLFDDCRWIDTMDIYPGMRLEIPLYFLTQESAYGNNIKYPLAINNAYIDSFATDDCEYHYPFVHWASCSFGNLHEDYMIDSSGNTWDSYSFVGFRDLLYPPYGPFLNSEPGDPPLLGLTFVVYVSSFTDLSNELVTDAIGPGYDPVSGPARIGDPEGGPGYRLAQYFSHLRFINTEYTPGDANMYNGQWPPSVIGGDVTYLANYFRSAPASQPCMLEGLWASADVNGDCLVIGSDVTRIVNYFKGNIDLSWCPDHPPSWPTPDDLPAEAPESWPNCEPY